MDKKNWSWLFLVWLGFVFFSLIISNEMKVKSPLPVILAFSLGPIIKLIIQFKRGYLMDTAWNESISRESNPIAFETGMQKEWVGVVVVSLLSIVFIIGTIRPDLCPIISLLGTKK